MSPPRGNYRWDRFVGDCAGGLIAALIALPYGLALASAMGLPPVLGIFTSILTAPIICLMGRNPVLIGGTASATVPFIALAARNHGIAGAARLSIMASVILIGFGIVRLGRHIAKVPHAVVTGFSCGIGGMMLVSQLDIMFGVASPLTRGAGSGFGQLAAVLRHLSEIRAVPLILGLTVIVAATLSARTANPLSMPSRSRLLRNTLRAAGDRSTKVTCAAPRLSASRPTAPEPAYKSRNTAPPPAPFMRLASTLKSVSRRRSLVGRVLNPGGPSSLREPYVPAMMRIAHQHNGPAFRRCARSTTDGRAPSILSF